MILFKRKVIPFCLFVVNLSSFQNEWTWSYQKKIDKEFKSKLGTKFWVFYRTEVPNYNQLIFSWNSYRPIEGYFSFYIQVRNSITKKWSKWFKMIDWGKDIQQSYSTIINGDISYHFVRLEIPKNEFSDGFKLKIESEKNAELSNLKMINICISNLSKFLPQAVDKNILKLPSVHVKNIPKKSQILLDHIDNKKMCSPTSTSMLISYLKKKEINAIDFAMNAYDNGLKVYGSWPFNAAHAFEKCPIYFFKVMRLNSFNELHSYLMKGLPVVVSVRGKLIGAPQEYNSGHLLLVNGWDQRNKAVRVHDPAFDQNYKVEHKYKIKTFLQAWERSHRLSYVVEKRY